MKDKTKRSAKKVGREIAISGIGHSGEFAKDVIRKLSGFAESEIDEATNAYKEDLLQEIKEIEDEYREQE